MITLDLRTLLAVLVMVCITYAVLTGALSLINNRRGVMSALAIGELFSGLGLGLISLRDVAPQWLGIVLANGLVMAGFCYHWLAARRLLGLRFPAMAAGGVIITATLALVPLTYLVPSLSVRVTLISLVIVGINGAVIRDALHHRHRAGWFMVGAYGAAAGLYLIRAAIGLTLPEPTDSVFTTIPATQNPLILLGILIHLGMVLSILWGFGMDWYRETAEAVKARTEMEQRLAHSEARCQSLLDLDSVAVVFTDSDGRITDANPAFCRLIQATSPRDLIGGELWRHSPSDDREREAPLRRALLGGQIRQYRLDKHLYRADGTTIRVVQTIATERGPSGRPVGLVVLIIDPDTQHHPDSGPSALPAAIG